MYGSDHHKTIEQLILRVGTKEECLRLGFLIGDDNATMHLSPAGLGYLIEVVAGDLTVLSDVCAAGYRQGYTQSEEEL